MQLSQRVVIKECIDLMKEIKVIVLYGDRKTFISEFKKIIISSINKLLIFYIKGYLFKYFTLPMGLGNREGSMYAARINCTS